MKMKILITCFEPYGMKGYMFNRNESKEIALKLQEKYNFETLILPVNKSCIQKLVSKLNNYKPTLVICLGQSNGGHGGLRIEGECSKGDKVLYSKFAQDIKKGLRGFVNDNIGGWYCNDIYYETLRRIPKTVFIHIPLYTKFNRVDRIIRFILKTESLYNSSSTFNNGRS
jgi:pyrrolidone-carboxylate peptidase